MATQTKGRRLLDAARRGNVALLRKLLKRDEQLNAVDDIGDTMLHKASHKGPSGRHDLSARTRGRHQCGRCAGVDIAPCNGSQGSMGEHPCPPHVHPDGILASDDDAVEDVCVDLCPEF